MRLETVSDFLGLHMESFKILDILFFNILNPFIVKKNMHGKKLRVFLKFPDAFNMIQKKSNSRAL